MKIIKYGASWCGPCRTTSENLKASGFPFEEIDVDENPEVPSSKGIRSIPYIEFYAKDNNSKPTTTHSGVLTVEKIKEICNKL